MTPEHLVAAAIVAPSADNSQPWQFEWDGRALAVRHRPPRGPDPFGPAGHAVLLSVGHVLANIARCLEAADLAHDLRLPVEPEKGSPYAEVSWIAGPPETDRQPGAPRSVRHTNRFPFAAAAIPPEARRAVAAATFGAARMVLFDVPAEIKALAAVVERCSAARFCTQELHDWLAASLRFTPQAVARGDGLDVATLHLPPGGAAFLRATSNWRVMRALNRLGIFRMLAKSEAMPLRRAPMLACIVGATDAVGVLAAGRLLAQVWEALNERGIAVHPYYAVTDQQLRLEGDRVPAEWRDVVGNAVARLPALLELGAGERLHMILRVGWPTVTPPRSRRLPIGNLYRDLTRAPRA